MKIRNKEIEKFYELVDRPNEKGSPSLGFSSAKQEIYYDDGTTRPFNAEEKELFKVWKANQNKLVVK